MKNESRPTFISWHLISPLLPRRWRLAIVLRKLSSMSVHPWGASTKHLLHKPPICPPKSIKDRLKILSPRLEQLKQKSQAPISQAGKKQMNTKVNDEKPGSTFKMPSRTKSPIRIKQWNVQGLTKPLQRTYSIESMDSCQP